jgi:hypothetical protein
MESMRTTSREARSWRAVHWRLLALVSLLAGIVGCETPHHNQRPCEPVGVGFTPTRWTSWQDGAMAYRSCRTSGGYPPDAAAPYTDRGTNPGAPAAEVVPPGREDETPQPPAKSTQRPQ